jgi:DNA-binding CsgD family transcriptional regulator
LVTETGDVILSNTEAQRIFDLSDGLGVGRDNRLSCDDPDSSTKLQALASAAGAAATAPSEPAILTIPRPSGQFGFVVSTGTIHDRLAELETGLACGFIVLIDPSRPTPLDVRGAAALGKLTPAETEIASALVAGLSVTQIAENRETSLHTIRTQLKTLSAKLRCNSQADIIRLAAATRLPLSEPSSKK